MFFDTKNPPDLGAKNREIDDKNGLKFACEWVQ